MRKKLGIFIKHLFEMSFIMYLFLLIIDLVKDSFVTNVFNMNFLLGLVLISGLLVVLMDYEELTQLISQKIKEQDWYYIIGFSLLGSFIVLIKTKELGNVSIIITFFTFIICILLSYITLTEDSN